jgi:uncharacterized protein (DUF2147 family)
MILRHDPLAPAVALVAVLVAFGPALAASEPARNDLALVGDWRATDGSSVARVAPCRSGPGLCATVVRERLEPGEPSQIGREVVRGLRPTGKGEWRGLYGDDGRLSARVRLRSADDLDLRVCAGPMLCETSRFHRIES